MNENHIVTRAINRVEDLSKRYFIFFMTTGMAFLYGIAFLYEKDLSIFILIFVLLFILSLRFWKFSFFLAMIWLIIGGAFRKWIFPGYEKLIFFIPYILLSSVYLHFIGKRIISAKRIFGQTGINLLLFFFLLLGIFEAFNPNVPEFMVSIIGLVIYFFFIPLLFITRYIFESRQAILRFFKMFALFSVPLLVLGIFQYYSPPDSPLNTYVRTEEVSSIALSGQFARITSTFSYISGYTQYLQILIMVAAYLLTVKGLSRKFVLFLYTLLPFIFVNLFMTGSRGPVAFSIIFILIYLTLVFTRNQGKHRRNVIRLITASMVGLILISSTFIGKQSYSTFSERLSGESSDIIPRVITTYTAPFRYFNEAGLIGFGIGTTYQAVQEQFKVGDMWRKMGIGFEEEPGRIMLELGLIGFIITYYIRFSLVRKFWVVSRETSTAEFKNLAIAILLFLLPFFMGVNVLVFNQTASFFYWLFAGFLLSIRDIDKYETSKGSTSGYNRSSS